MIQLNFNYNLCTISDLNCDSRLITSKLKRRYTVQEYVYKVTCNRVDMSQFTRSVQLRGQGLCTESAKLYGHLLYKIAHDFGKILEL